MQGQELLQLDGCKYSATVLITFTFGVFLDFFFTCNLLSKRDMQLINLLRENNFSHSENAADKAKQSGTLQTIWNLRSEHVSQFAKNSFWNQQFHVPANVNVDVTQK